MPSATRTIISQRENSNYRYLIVCFTWFALFFSIRLFSIAICLLCIICEKICNEIDAFCDTLRQVTAD